MDDRTATDHVLALCPGAQHLTVDGDTFFFRGEDRQISFATLVTRDDHDAAPVSGLERAGVYRLNIGVGKETYTRLFGPPPPHPEEWSVAETGHDDNQLDRLVLHPTYSPMAWVCVLNPSEETFANVVPLLQEAYEKAEPQAKARLAKLAARTGKSG